ncbi:Hypothetical Protein FCC1311_038482 [Hondaea fermentalgiana]|uniref:UVR domain-containing protein n=1 Tax=Hondaea fermentalgiana TaxID=2315210 RepID=A0A2R5GAJ8_9STRA|nr:Hypothetical Protein FCC1311_038482 [Hondaea fermentalgiana]|eukprot:GBG27625.1 Hypothetical Protein FCC1311_038482 [Hondaea fermentalgiana]
MATPETHELAVNPNEHKLERSKLINVRCLKEAFGLFGVQEGDRIETRDLVILTATVEEELKAVKQECESARDYDAAAKVRDRLRNIQEEFLSIQLQDQAKDQADERRKFEDAKRKISRGLDSANRDAYAELEALCDTRLAHLQHAHDVQRANLESYIENMHRPRVRYSKGLLDLMHSEKHLRNFDQFEDAKAVDRIIAKRRPKEVAHHERQIQHKISVLRRKLAERQEFELVKLREKLHDLKLRHERNHERRLDMTQVRMQLHFKDMSNRHMTVGQKPERFCAVRGGRVRPVVKKRAGYRDTDATFRGTQLLRSVQGDAIKDVVSLCQIHKFGQGDAPYEDR